jgi:hypothetical protein
MLSSLLRPKKGRKRVEQHSPFSSQYADQSSPILARNRRREARHVTADFTETELDDENTEDEEDVDEDEDEEELEGDDEDGDGDTPLLPIFSAAHLGQFSLHVSRKLLTIPRCYSSL